MEYAILQTIKVTFRGSRVGILRKFFAVEYSDLRAQLFFQIKILVMLFSKEDLGGSYEWKTDSEKSVFEGDASRRVFNRWNGNQVLFIINLILNNSGNFSVNMGRNIEKLIMERLPIDTKSELTVLNWLQLEITNENRIGRADAFAETIVPGASS